MALGTLDVHGRTDRGSRRTANADHFLIAHLSKSMYVSQSSVDSLDPTRLYGGSQGHLLVVADGMHGAQAGDAASSLAVEAITHYVLNTMPWYFRLDQEHEEALRDDLSAALEKCNQTIRELAHLDPSREGMGTSLTLAYVLWPRMYVLHAGDCRCYVLRDGQLEQLTIDHTLSSTLARAGEPPPEPGHSRLRHVLWNAVGGRTDQITTDVYGTTLQINDTVLLCTDGLAAQVEDRRIGRLLERAVSAEGACDRLVEAVQQERGRDDVTVVVARFGSSEQPAPLGDPAALMAGPTSPAESTPKSQPEKTPS